MATPADTMINSAVIEPGHRFLGDLGPAVDLPAAERAVADLLAALGQDPSGHPGLADTPRRVAASFAEMLEPKPFRLTTFPNEGYDEMVVARDIPFNSLCMHHLLPFKGVAHVGLPAGQPHRRPIQAGPGGGDVRPPAAGAGGTHYPDRRLP